MIQLHFSNFVRLLIKAVLAYSVFILFFFFSLQLFWIFPVNMYTKFVFVFVCVYLYKYAYK